MRDFQRSRVYRAEMAFSERYPSIFIADAAHARRIIDKHLPEYLRLGAGLSLRELPPRSPNAGEMVAYGPYDTPCTIFWKPGAASEQTIIHELAHAYTVSPGRADHGAFFCRQLIHLVGVIRGPRKADFLARCMKEEKCKI